MSRRRLALLAFLFHGPGLRLLAGYRFSRPLFRANVVALALTLAAMAVALLAAPPGSRGLPVLIAWAIGHFAWSVILASVVSREGAAPPPAR
ncbi:MAG: hypothetical protein KC636_28700 [Myxococcales bacterium]|nr:hypothetical protein [Myxococcales bacterium]